MTKKLIEAKNEITILYAVELSDKKKESKRANGTYETVFDP